MQFQIFIYKKIQNGKKLKTGIVKQHIGKNSLSKFMKDLIHETGIEIDGLLTNHSGRKISAQLMQDINVE
ncbi:16939_t:CDS:2 [Funneliformis mosseae]|uniref:16939_t:CDS:1 n=1 Tax=Funneliformis mosseae TaxID=27381 RepID=A0A9N8ZL54_FUNMO|nr:16939_t:CDS:2 [Funneliformis mosseae]